jgi:hypothetical protein
MELISILAAIALTMPQVEMSAVRGILSGTGSLTTGGRMVGAKVRDCRVLSFAGGAAGAERLCQVFERQRLKPAKGAQGAPIHAVFETVIWAHPDEHSVLPPLPETEPLLELSVDRLPTGADNPFLLSLGLVIDEAGSVTSCGAFKEGMEAYSRAACGLLESETFQTLSDRRGNAVPYAMQVGARLSTDTEPSA